MRLGERCVHPACPPFPWAPTLGPPLPSSSHTSLASVSCDLSHAFSPLAPRLQRAPLGLSPACAVEGLATGKEQGSRASSTKEVHFSPFHLGFPSFAPQTRVQLYPLAREYLPYLPQGTVKIK